MPTANAPEALSARFRQDLIALTRPFDASARIGLAVSGGPDSLGLLLLAVRAFPGQVAVATVDHGLRPEAADEAAMVGRVCDNLDVPHAILSGNSAKIGNVQANARMLRYRLLGDWAEREKLTAVATAHHRDDVAESFLMRALRGSGTAGLARMRAIGPIPYAPHAVARLVRPLLEWTRAELAEIVRDAGLAPATDPSNDDPRYDRVRIRALLRQEATLDPGALARVSANIADAEAALEWMADQAWRSRVTAQDITGISLDPSDLPVEIRRRLAARALAALAPGWNGEGLDRLLARLETGETATLAGVKACGGAPWRFGIAPARSDHC